jgi:large subunit ribosomal protein L21
MYAIIDVAGQQFKVEKGQKIYVHRLTNEEGSDINLDKVLLIDDEGKITIGEPLINGAFVEGKVLTHLKGDKVIVFKKKRRKGYKVKNGHRQQFSHIEILTINEKGAPKKSVAKATPAPEAKKETPVAKETKTTAAKKPSAKAPVAKKPAAKAPAKKAAEKKPAAKKPAAKKPAAKTATAKTATAKKPAAKTTTAKKATASKAAAKPKAAPKKDKPAGDTKK